MTEQEFDKWLNDYAVAFPSVLDWLDRIPDQTRTLQRWHMTLKKIPLDHAVMVTDRLAAGELPDIPAYDREKTAMIVRRHAFAILEKEDRKRQQADMMAESSELREENRQGKFPAGRLYVKAVELWEQARKKFPDDERSAKRWVHEQMNDMFNAVAAPHEGNQE